jgi:O-antigen ligase
MYLPTPRPLVLSPTLQLAGLLGLGGASALLAWKGDPELVPMALVGLTGAAILLRWPHLGILSMFALVLFKPAAIQGGLSANAVLAAALIPSLFLDLLVRRRFTILQSNLLRIFLLLGLVIAVNWYLWGRVQAPGYLDDLDSSNRELVRFGFNLVFLTLLVAFIRTRGQVMALTGLFLLSVLWTLPGAISRSYSPPASGQGSEALRAMAVSGVQAAENANRLAFIALMAISIVWFWLRESRNTVVRLVGTGVLLTLVLTVFLSGSRSGVLNLGLLLILLLSQTRIRPGHIAGIVLLVIACVAVAALLVPQPILDRIAAMAGGSNDESKLKGVAESTTRRQVVLMTGLTFFGENPFMGIGVGNFRWMTASEPRFGGVVMAAHNAYLLALAEGGILLLGAYLMLFWVTARNLSWALKRAEVLPHIGLEWLVRATRVNLFLLLFFSLFAEAWKEFYLLLILATAAILTQIYRRGSADA